MRRILLAPLLWIASRWDAADTRLASFYADPWRDEEES